ncbi:hypothetical protein HYY69_04245 [Candidatus Woesearchaeota archaeon]|nr:hypothetical protein [Candidatus Woesearchaeota archaeon]
MPRKQQNAQRVRLAGAVSLPEVKAADSGLEIYWRGGDGRDYQATLVGLDSKRGYAVVTQVTSEWKKDPYRAWRAENGPWF